VRRTKRLGCWLGRSQALILPGGIQTGSEPPQPDQFATDSAVARRAT